MIRQIRLASALAVMAATTAFAAPAAAQVAGVPLDMEPRSCDRACLESYVERYLQAMSDGEVSDDLFARNVRFTENGVQMPLGDEGLWATTSSPQGYRLIVPDVVTGQVAALVTVQEAAGSSATGPTLESDPVGISLRLRIDTDGKISEVEQIAARPERPLGPNAGPPSSPFPATGEAVEALGSPWPGYLEAVPEAERHTRAELVEVASAYFEAVERNTGNDYYPFTDDCLRYENGIITAGPEGSGARAGCREQLQTTLIGAVTSIRDRRIVAVDVERGVVFAFAFFDHRPINWSWQLGELFKVENGDISRIEAIFIRGPYGICSGWSTYEQCRSEEPMDVR
ncbi:hypothetical protein [Alteraurantiacibacter aquimixticola]|uniref:DUF8021 domain-containing protein n=1 Tax=Alteraurantiacibacter aquimixticola TaxID=2489173 RepID=A0A4T3F0Q6_9SPHN|nr:hypothetical protein [Alteraurantiacibacter aquimixticola]TIX50629.1 hypothetical protein E5222_10250 [Alteraurantiacibacter aquimixticola]